MATATGNVENEVWPMPKFRFEVDMGDKNTRAAFQEVSGMDVEVQSIEYRHSNSPLFAPIKMPGIAKYSNVTLKRGIFVKQNMFYDWVKEIKMNTIARRTVTIKLLDEKGEVTMSWKLFKAWPTKITATDLKSDGNEVAIDTLEIAHEQLVIENV